VTDLRQLSMQMIAAKSDLEESMAEHERRVHESAEADRVARVAKASAYLAASGAVAERQAHVDQTTADVQYRAKLADGLEKSALEAVRSRRQVLSSLQSLAALARAEVDLAKWGPSEAESA
jgi:hypothetical protein